ncbi:ATP-binding protein [Roseateles aquatilis]|uniref:ATP-binding protein n=1 Tax=Roseateles aquatilis TaxID=431061 RepID=UPI001303A6B5|nr:winged helix-turn-helix domain-containing protein [Roseateles aquatilis]
MPTPATPVWKATFEPFTLVPAERLLLRDGLPVRLGGRALDLLIALVARAGEVVGKRELMQEVWGDLVVDEGSLRFHMYAVRKALGDGVDGRRFVVNTASKGYSFVAAVHRAEPTTSSTGRTAAGPAPTPPKALPASASALVGRDEDIAVLATLLVEHRFVSVVGAGGIGKSSVAIHCMQATRHFFPDVYFVDLSELGDGALVRAAVAAAIGLNSGDVELPAIVHHLSQRKFLLLLDCCEHVVDEAARLAEQLFAHCPSAHILTTSREPLRAEGEHVNRLQPLAFPAEGEGDTAASALAFPAVKLFVDRAASGGSGFQLSDADAPLLSQLCRELDGIALAIELAAGRVEALGLQAISSHLDKGLKLRWHGRRTAVPRQQTLHATLDWSFNLLTEDERSLLCRLSVFATSFSLESAFAICCFDLDEATATETMAGLVSKSLISVDAGGAVLRYVMLDTTRAYGRKKLADVGDAPDLMERFARHFASWVADLAPALKQAEGLERAALDVPNVRAALEHLLASPDRARQALDLAAAFCPLLLGLSRLAECSRWSRLALDGLPAELRETALEMQLQGALGQSLVFTGGDGTSAFQAFRRAIDIAERLGDVRAHLHLLNGYALLLHRDGQFTAALNTARRAQALLAKVDDPELSAIVDSLLGVALHLVGEIGEAERHWDLAFSHFSGRSTDTTSRLGFDHQIRSLCGKARSLWYRGRFIEAMSVADDTMERARRTGHAATYCIALVWAGSVAVLKGDAVALTRIVETVEVMARRHSFLPYLHLAGATRGQILIAAGNPAAGVELIRKNIELLGACRYEMVTSVFLTTLARGLCDMSLHDASLGTCDRLEARIRTGGDFLRLPEALLARGRTLSTMGRRDEAIAVIEQSLGLARTQGSVPGQLRAATALARERLADGDRRQAGALLDPLLTLLRDEDSPDLAIARGLL